MTTFRRTRTRSRARWARAIGANALAVLFFVAVAGPAPAATADVRTMVAREAASTTTHLAAPTAGGPAVAKARCDPTLGWAAVSGRPSSLQRLGSTGLYVWNERGVWRVAVTHGDRDPRTFQGTISFDTAMSSRPVGIDGRFDLVVPNANAASFTFKNIGGIDSILATSFCASTVTVTATLDGQPLTPAQIFIGASATNPSANPAILSKGSAGASATVSAPTVSSLAPQTVLPTVPSTVAGVPAAACSVGSWPLGTVGRPPGLRPKTAAGLFAWSEKTGWTVLVSGDPGRPQLFAGRVTVVVAQSSGGVVAQPIGLEARADAVRVEGNTVVFSMRTGNGFDGFQVVAPCATAVTIEGTIDGVAMSASQVFIGASAISPSALPFTVSR